MRQREVDKFVGIAHLRITFKNGIVILTTKHKLKKSLFPISEEICYSILGIDILAREIKEIRPCL